MLDSAIIVGYFILILVVGITVSKSVKSLKDFSSGNKNYSSAVIFATLSASFIGGGFTTGLAEKVYTLGLIYVVALWGFSLKEILVATVIAPRLTPFKDALTVGDIIGQLYGRYAKILTGVASGLVCAGIAGAQFSAFGYFLNVLTGIPSLYGIILGACIVMTYSTLGGLKSVVANDVIHFCVLVVALPLVLLFGLKQAGGLNQVLSTLPSGNFLEFSTISGLTLLGLFLNFFFGETLVPPYVQRLLIGKNFKETARGTFWSGMLSIPFFLIVGLIGLVALTLNPSLNPNLALPYVINTVMPIGLKGLAIAGMMAVVMSSADAFLNAAAISITHDVIKPLKREGLASLKELRYSRIMTVIVGSLGALFALSTQSALDILLLAYNFWTPFILVPLVAGILEFKPSLEAFWLGALAGILTTCCALTLVDDATINAAIFGIAANLIVFMVVKAVQMRAINIASE